MYPGPQKYWKIPSEQQLYGKRKKKKKPLEELQVNDDGTKNYYLYRETTDKRVYKPMKSYIY